MQAYWNPPRETAETWVQEGWRRTGDRASINADGYLAIVDRVEDLIIASGYTVFPREVKEVLYRHPDVVEAVVLGVPYACGLWLRLKQALA